jgi:3-oxoacyl-[acyl-carrier protein] reductase
MSDESQESKRKVVLVLGASGVLGSSVSKQFETKGVEVLTTGFHSKPQNERSFQVDITLPSDVDKLVEWVKSQTEQLDAIVHCVGSIADGFLSNISSDNWRRVLDANLKSAFLITKGFLPFLVRQRKGHFIFISSWGGVVGRIGQTNYASSKAALIGFTQSVAREYASRGIRANCVVPGVFQSPMLAKLSPEKLEKIWEGAALKEFGDLDEMTQFIAHLAFMKSVTGQVFHLDGRIPSVLG